jgi:hypothetical protein
MRQLFVLVFGVAPMQGGFTTAQYSSYIDPLEQAAIAALSGDAVALRAFTDTVENRLPLRFHPSVNLNERLSQAELHYREHKHPGVSTEQLASAMNQFASDLELPAYVKTNANQVQTYRMMAARVFPTLVKPDSQAPNQPTDLSMSSSVALFLLLELFQMKMTEPSYQIDPDSWVRDVEAKRKEAASRPPSRSAVFTVGRSSPKQEALARRYEALARTVASNTGRAERAVQIMLKNLGL